MSTVIFPVKSKSLYVKFINLIDNEKFNHPLYKKKIYRSDDTIDVFSSAVSFAVTEFSDNPPTSFKSKTTSQGVVDAFGLYPFQLPSKSLDPGENANKQQISSDVDISSRKFTSTVNHYLNGYTRGNEWHGARAVENSSELRLILDFSSIPTKSGELDDLFKKEPIAYYTSNSNGDVEEKEIPMEFRHDNVFCASWKDVLQGNIVKMKWITDWDSLLEWNLSGGDASSGMNCA